MKVLTGLQFTAVVSESLTLISIQKDTSENLPACNKIHIMDFQWESVNKTTDIGQRWTQNPSKKKCPSILLSPKYTIMKIKIYAL